MFSPNMALCLSIIINCILNADTHDQTSMKNHFKHERAKKMLEERVPSRDFYTELHTLGVRSEKGTFQIENQPSDHNLKKRNSDHDSTYKDEESEYALSPSDFLNLDKQCCGSVMPINTETAQSAGSFTRIAVAGSLKVVDIPDKDTDIVPPIVISDLQIDVPKPRTIQMKWTAPGDNLDEGKVSRYDIRLSNRSVDLQNNNFNKAAVLAQVKLDENVDDPRLFVEAGGKVSFTINIDDEFPVTLRPTVRYFMAIRAYDDQNNTSPVSRPAHFTLPSLGSKFVVTSPTTTTTPSTITATQRTLETSPSSNSTTKNDQTCDSRHKCSCPCKAGKKNKNKKKCKGKGKCKRKNRFELNPNTQELQAMPGFLVLWDIYNAMECNKEEELKDKTSKLYSAILGLRMAKSYLSKDRDACKRDFICNTLNKLEKRAKHLDRRLDLKILSLWNN